MIAGCERNQYLYQFGDVPDGIGMDVQEITSELFLADIGTRFRWQTFKAVSIKRDGWAP